MFFFFRFDFSRSNMWVPSISVGVIYSTLQKIHVPFNGISHVVSQFIVNYLEKFGISLGLGRVKEGHANN